MIAPNPEAAQAFEVQWQRLGRAGTWWSAVARIDIAREVRAAASCALCAQRKQAVSPYAVAGTHRATAALGVEAVDAVHRIVTDQGRLSSKWHDEVTAAISLEQLVELVAVVAIVTAADSYRRALGAGLRELPSAAAGEPTRVRPDGVDVSVARVPTVTPEKATGVLRELYDAANSPIGIPNIRKALTLVPDDSIGFSNLTAALYVPADVMSNPTWSWPDLTRPQMELVATTVSAENECFY